VGEMNPDTLGAWKEAIIPELRWHMSGAWNKAGFFEGLHSLSKGMLVLIPVGESAQIPQEGFKIYPEAVTVGPLAVGDVLIVNPRSPIRWLPLTGGGDNMRFVLWAWLAEADAITCLERECGGSVPCCPEPQPLPGEKIQNDCHPVLHPRQKSLDLARMSDIASRAYTKAKSPDPPGKVCTS